MIWIFSLIIFNSAWAFDSTPAYQTYIDDRPILTSTQKIDSEYASHFLNYSFDVEDDILWAQKNKIYQISAGSLNSKEFSMEQRLKLLAPFTSNWSFQLNYYEEKNFEELGENLIWSIDRQLNGGLSAHLLGQTSLSKEHSDIGFALGQTTGEKLSSKLSVLCPDFQKNKRGQSGEKWRSKPVVISFTNHRFMEKQFSSSYFRLEPKSKLVDPSGITITRQKESLGFSAKHERDNKNPLYTKFHFDRYEEDQIERFRYLFKASTFNYLGGRKIMWGLASFYREYETGTQRSSIFDILPYTWVNIKENQRQETKHITQLGFDLTYNDIGDSANIIKAQSEDSYESRLSLKHNIHFNKNGSFTALLTFDTDEIGTNELWEGGALQLQALF